MNTLKSTTYDYLIIGSNGVRKFVVFKIFLYIIYMQTNIYILIDPVTKEVKYVGKSNNPIERFKNHKNRSRDINTHKRNWINKLRKNNLYPEIEIIDIVPINNWRYWETFWIQYFTFLGSKLTNYTMNGIVGGEGLTYGNRTSFKKGNKSWNEGTAHKSKCIECGIDFKSNPSNNRKLCSLKCTSLYKSKNQNITNFKKDSIPWNKGTKGSYILSGKKICKKVIRIDIVTKEEIEFNSCLEASKFSNCTSCNIRNCCLGKSKTAKGYYWKFKN